MPIGLMFVWLAAVVLAAVSAEFYLRDLKKSGYPIRSNAEFRDEILHNPRRLFHVTLDETAARFRAMRTRQLDPSLEAQRTLAQVLLVVALAAHLLLTLVLWGIGG